MADFGNPMDPADPYGGDPMLKWFLEQQGMGAPAAAPIPPLDITSAPVPTEIAGPAGPALPVPEAPAPTQEQWWPSSWLAGGDAAAAAMNQPAVEAIEPAPIPPPPVDAISGVDALPPPTSQDFDRTGLGPALGALGMPLPTAEIARDVALDYNPFLDANDATAGERFDKLAQRDPVRAAGLIREHELAREKEVAAERTRRATALQDRAEREAAAYQAAAAEAQRKTEELGIEADRIAQSKIDPNRWFHNQGTFGKIAALAQAMIGGLISATKGGANQGLALIMRAIDQDIDAQKFDIQNARAGIERKQTAVAQSFARSGDIYQAQTAARLAALRALDDQLATYAAGIDPRGSQMVEVQKARSAARAAIAAEAHKYAVFQHQVQKDAAKQKLDEQEFAEKVRHSKAEEGIAWTNASTSSRRLAFDEKKSDRDYALDIRKEDRQDKELKFKQDELAQKHKDALAEKDRDLGVGSDAKIVMVDGMVRDPATGEMRPGKVEKVVADSLRNPDGSVWHAPKEAAAKIRESRDATQDMKTILEKLIAVRNRVGGTNKVTSPNDDAEVKQLASQAIIALNKADGVSISDQQSVDLAKDALFGGDPTSYRADDVVNRARKTLDLTVAKYHQKLKGAQYKGVLPRFEAEPPPAVNTTQEDRTKQIIQAKTPYESAGDIGKLSGRAKERRLGEDEEALFIETINEAAMAKDQATRDRARVELVNLAAERPEISGAVIPRIYDVEPALVRAAMKRVSDKRRAAIEDWIQLREQWGRDFEAKSQLTNPLFNSRYE